MKGGKNIGWIILAAILIIFGVWGCSSYNGLVDKDEAVTKSWANVNTEYQKRYDLIDNLVEVVKGAADFEKETLTQVVEARAKATSVNFTADQLTPENMAKFQQVQSEMSGALSRLLVTVENYPQLKATENFTRLQNSVEGIENEVRNARNNFNEAVREYNVKVRRFPGNIMANLFDFEKKESFKSDEGAEKAPKIKLTDK
jgi:LemA protein